MDGGQNLAAMATTAFALCDTASPTTSVPEATYPALMLGAGILVGGFVLYWRRRSLATI
jgi:LPXTG-motif cell wall-anchored protein